VFKDHRLCGLALVSAALIGCAASLATAHERDLVDVFDEVRGSVVTITTTGRTLETSGAPQLVTARNVGSGVLIDADGSIMTASHVVHTADVVMVRFLDSPAMIADVISSDPMTDLALIRVRDDLPEGAVVARLGDSGDDRIGSRVFIVGAPRGISHTLTVGHLSARRKSPRQLKGLIDLEVFQTDAAVNPGNSGGPMFDMDGEVIGIVSYIVTRSGGSEGLGFAITSNVAREVLLNEPAFWSGLDSVMLQGEVARAFNVPGDGAGILVQHVAKGSEGAKMGIRGGAIVATIAGEEVVIGGDIIVEVLGIAIEDGQSVLKVRQKFATLSAGDRFEVVVIRAGKRLKLNGRVPKELR
jgi:S1-C subfamily serine protease